MRNDVLILAAALGVAGIACEAGEAETAATFAAKAWDWWCVDGVRYHGKDVTILFDRDGTRYGKGKGLVVLSADTATI